MQPTTTPPKLKSTAPAKATTALRATPPTITSEAPNQSVFDLLPNSGYVREAQLVQSPKRPDTPAPLPFSAPTLWRKVKAGTFPKPTKLSQRVTAFNVGEVRAWMLAQATA